MKIRIWVYLMFFNLLFFSCTKNDIVPPDTEESTETKIEKGIYIAGAELDDESSNISTAVYWANRKITRLTDGTLNSVASGITIDHDDLYVCGIVDNRAVYWKNNKINFLSDEAKNGVATDLVVHAGDVYVAGEEDGVAVVWKNGNRIPLSSKGDDAQATSIKFLGNDMYVAGAGGFERDGAYLSVTARYWKNEELVNLFKSGSFLYSEAYSIYLDRSDIYIAGYSTLQGISNATYWKNGEIVHLSPLPEDLKEINQETEAFDVISDEATVYVSGTIITYKTGSIQYPVNYLPVCWINNQMTYLENNGLKGSAARMAKDGGSIYIVGNLDDKAVYWKDSQVVSLSSKNSAAISIYINN